MLRFPLVISQTLFVFLSLSDIFLQLGATSSLPHLLFYGPSGGGKKTRVMALLRELFGDAVDKVGWALS